MGRFRRTADCFDGAGEGAAGGDHLVDGLGLGGFLGGVPQQAGGGEVRDRVADEKIVKLLVVEAWLAFQTASIRAKRSASALVGIGSRGKKGKMP